MTNALFLLCLFVHRSSRLVGLDGGLPVSGLGWASGYGDGGVGIGWTSGLGLVILKFP